jgi:tRNA-modifying protein YgfZ
VSIYFTRCRTVRAGQLSTGCQVQSKRYNREMNLEAYNAVRSDPNGCGVGLLRRSWISLTGRDRASFLNGQVSNDIVHLQPGGSIPACLLNNVGHMMANLTVHAVADELLIEVNPSRAKTVAQTLGRFVVREKVEIRDVTAALEALTVQGLNAGKIVAAVFGEEAAGDAVLPQSNAAIELEGGEPGLLVRKMRTPAGGFDLIVRAGLAEPLCELLSRVYGARLLDSETMHVLRVEAGIPAWGAELDESVIPLEANLHAAIDRNKGCYMGQEVIARILSRGHTNRRLAGFRLSGLTEAGATLKTENSADAGRITSVAESPEFGPIALGYARNEYSEPGTTLTAEGGVRAIVAALPLA